MSPSAGAQTANRYARALCEPGGRVAPHDENGAVRVKQDVVSHAPDDGPLQVAKASRAGDDEVVPDLLGAGDQMGRGAEDDRTAIYSRGGQPVSGGISSAASRRLPASSRSRSFSAITASSL